MTEKHEELHRSAMETAARARLEHRAGRHASSCALIHAALRDELAAIGELAGDVDDDPTLAALARKAANLALDCGEPRIAARIASRALLGNPHRDIEAELHEVLLAVLARNRNHDGGVA